MGRHPGAAHRKRHNGGGKVVRWACPDCGIVVMISRANLSRLFMAAMEYHGTNHLALDLGDLPKVNWAGYVSDELIHQAVLLMTPVTDDE